MVTVLLRFSRIFMRVKGDFGRQEEAAVSANVDSKAGSLLILVSRASFSPLRSLELVLVSRMRKFKERMDILSSAQALRA